MVKGTDNKILKQIYLKLYKKFNLDWNLERRKSKPKRLKNQDFANHLPSKSHGED